MLVSPHYIQLSAKSRASGDSTYSTHRTYIASMFFQLHPRGTRSPHMRRGLAGKPGTQTTRYLVNLEPGTWAGPRKQPNSSRSGGKQLVLTWWDYHGAWELNYQAIFYEAETQSGILANNPEFYYSLAFYGTPQK